jgi:hypothetical protein
VEGFVAEADEDESEDEELDDEELDEEEPEDDAGEELDDEELDDDEGELEEDEELDEDEAGLDEELDEEELEVEEDEELDVEELDEDEEDMAEHDGCVVKQNWNAKLTPALLWEESSGLLATVTRWLVFTSPLLPAWRVTTRTWYWPPGSLRSMWTGWVAPTVPTKVPGVPTPT